MRTPVILLLLFGFVSLWWSHAEPPAVISSQETIRDAALESVPTSEDDLFWCSEQADQSVRLFLQGSPVEAQRKFATTQPIVSHICKSLVRDILQTGHMRHERLYRKVFKTLDLADKAVNGDQVYSMDERKKLAQESSEMARATRELRERP